MTGSVDKFCKDCKHNIDNFCTQPGVSARYCWYHDDFQRTGNYNFDDEIEYNEFGDIIDSNTGEVIVDAELDSDEEDDDDDV